MMKISDDLLNQTVEQWFKSENPTTVFKQLKVHNCHALNFGSTVYKKMRERNDFLRFSDLIQTLDDDDNVKSAFISKQGYFVNRIGCFANKVMAPNSFELLQWLTTDQQNRVLPDLVAQNPNHISHIEKVIGRSLPDSVVFQALIPSFSNLERVKDLSSRISSSKFLQYVSGPLKTSFPDGGVKTFARWLALPDYSLKFNGKEFEQFNNMLAFLDDKTIDQKNLDAFMLVKRLLNTRQDSTVLDAFIQRCKIFNEVSGVRTTPHMRKI